ncbi:P-loop containing nucleoside triphosphate hydrolase protein [Lentinus tigrinus ALCF2SS1-7]|uniref:P-loop containing nucleoside triphosphate hydrolase protein n=1 Tax=Lentinus tigrinus ALCF2SS1-7 TaxID=1328758 RepID=UPI0011662F43|nr:P-loop containing nucleoside triphosphate hydrolase protein [Lentinus tigrinus ALCF2SS1-7]
MLARRRLSPRQLSRSGTLITLGVLPRYASTSAPGDQPFVLRPYQESCLEECLKELEKYPRRIGVSLPTGSGKTAVFLSLIARLPVPATQPDATRSLVVVGSIEVAKQTVDQARKLFPHWTIEVDQGKQKASGLADLTVATVNSLSRRVDKYSVEHMKVIIVDEAHHAAAPSYRGILSRFNSAIDHPDAKFLYPAVPNRVPIVGFTATFTRHDGQALASVFDGIAYHLDIQELIDKKWLCDVRFLTVQAKMGLGQVSVNKRTGDFFEQSLSSALNTNAMNELIVRVCREKASDRKSILIFCVSLKHMRAVAEAFRVAGVDARTVDGRTSARQRAALVEQFKVGKYPVLVNCGVFTEGTDIPNIDCVVIARPTLSPVLLSQMVGRGMRQSPQTGKKDCLIIDLADSRSHVPGLLSAPRIFGRDPAANDHIKSPNHWIFGMAMRETQKRLEELRDAAQIPIVVYVDENNPFDVPDQASGDPQLRALSWNNWIHCGVGRGFYILETSSTDCGEPPSGLATFETFPARTATQYIAQHSPYQHRTRDLLTASTLREAIQHCDECAAEWMGTQYDRLLRAAAWRWEPASHTQKSTIYAQLPEYLALCKRDGKASPGLIEEVEEMTKGTAHNLISRISHEAASWKVCPSGGIYYLITVLGNLIA